MTVDPHDNISWMALYDSTKYHLGSCDGDINQYPVGVVRRVGVMD